MSKMKDTTKQIFMYLKEHDGENHTSDDVAEALGLNKRQVDGSFTAAIQRRKPEPLGYREEAEIELADGSHKKVKFLRLNALGLAFDPDAAEE